MVNAVSYPQNVVKYMKCRLWFIVKNVTSNECYFSKPYLSDLSYTFANKSVKNEYYGTVFDWGTRILVMCGGQQVN